MTFLLADLLKDSAYRLTQFSAEKIAALESAITIKDPGKKPAPYVTCLVRGKPIKLTPEEARAAQRPARPTGARPAPPLWAAGQGR